MSTDVEKHQPDRRRLMERDPMGLADHFYRSGYFPDLQSLSQAVVKIATGEELGLGPMTSMRGIHIIKGQPSFAANLMASRVKSSGRYDYRVKKADAESCEIQWFEHGEVVGVSEYTLGQARRAGLVKEGSNWAKTPEDMLFARAVSRGVRRFCPDVMAGVTAYVPEELESADVAETVTATVEVDPEPEPETVEDAEVVPENEAPVKTISKAEAGRIYDAAVAVDSIEPDQFAQAVGFVLETDPGDISKKGKAVEVLATLSEEQAVKVKGWIEKKQAAAEREAARIEEEGSGE